MCIRDSRYRELTREEIPGYRTMFQHMVENDGGALVMCSFGKDRAGIASALLLSALGVLPEQVEADYLLSAVAYADEDAAISKFEQFFSAQGLPVDREIVLPILDARPQYLNVAFDLIDREAGGMDRFLHTELGMGPAERELLVRRFTRPRG